MSSGICLPSTADFAMAVISIVVAAIAAFDCRLRLLNPPLLPINKKVYGLILTDGIEAICLNV